LSRVDLLRASRLLRPGCAAMADIAAGTSLYDLLAESLPKDAAFTFYHYSTPPTKSPPLFAAPPHAKPERTYCESHFLAASIQPKDAPHTAASDELLVLAIEVLVYTTKHLTTIFVSKADSTGYLSLLGTGRAHGSPLKAICGTFVSWLAKERQREGRRTVVSLFARAQDQYLFSASIENKGKHLLDDKELVRWWCKVLDPLVKEYKEEEAPKSLSERLAAGPVTCSDEYTAKGYLVIPGFEPHDTLRYYTPPPALNASRRWSASHPLLQIAPHPAAPPRCMVPHFPDDPKARFLDELDDELPDRGTDAMTKEGGTPSRSNGQWKSVKTLDQFWEFMAFRQECSSGRIVGFIWVVITPPKPSIPEEDEFEPSQLSSFSQDTLPPSPPPKQKKSSLKKSRRRKINTDHGPIPLVRPRIKSSSSNVSTMSTGSTGAAAAAATAPESTAYYWWPTKSRGTVVLSSKNYNRAHEVLLQQNFSTQAAATRSTRRWKEEVAVLGHIDDWSRSVVGRREMPSATVPAANGVSVTLVGTRKKRKPTDAAVSDQSAPGAAMLGGGLVRKKPKVEAIAPDGVNTLGAGLVRKKPKN
jgi:regulator of Ty1 transposition protein 109